MRTSVTNRIAEYAQQDERVFLISGDAGYGVLDTYQKRFPKQYLNLGIAEQNMISFAAGLGIVGYKVFVYDIAPFVLYRCYEQVRNDICYQRLPVTLIGIGSGVTYAPGGMTHYSVEDIAIARTLPGLVILSPSDPIEARCSIEFAITSEHPVYIRIAKKGEPIIHKDNVEDITKPQCIREGSDVAVLFHGSISQEVLIALNNMSCSPVIVSVPMIHPLDFVVLAGILQNVHTIITVEEHFINGGLGSIIEEWIVKERLPFMLKKLGFPNEFLHAVRNPQGMRELYGFSSAQIKNVIKEAFKNG